MRIPTFVAAAGLALAANLAAAREVSYDFDKAADFRKFKTYAWVQGTELQDPLNHKRVVDAVDAQLAAKGLRKAEAGAQPDVLVAYHASFDKSLRITGFSSGFGGYRFAASRTGTARAEEILTGTLVVDIVDAATKTIVWRGTASKDLDTHASPEKKDKNVNAAARKLFKNYPPQS